MTAMTETLAPPVNIVTFGLHFTTQIHRTASFLTSLLHTPKPVYDTILWLLVVRYDLAALTCTIRSCRLSVVRYQSRSHAYYDT